MNKLEQYHGGHNMVLMNCFLDVYHLNFELNGEVDIDYFELDVERVELVNWIKKYIG